MKIIKFIFFFCFSLNVSAQEVFTLTVNLLENVENNAISIYKKTEVFPHYEFVVYRFLLDFGLNELEVELTEGEYLLKSFNLFEGNLEYDDEIMGELNWTISNNLQGDILAQGIEGNSEFTICYTEDCLLDCDYLWEPVCVNESIVYGNECLANKGGSYSFISGICNENLYNTAFVGEEFNQSVYLGHDNSATDGFAIPLYFIINEDGVGIPLIDPFSEIDWLSYDYDNDCDLNPSFENLVEYGGYTVQLCAQGIPSVNDVGEFYIWVSHVDPLTQTVTYIPRRFQVFELENCSSLQTFVEDLNSTVLPANIILNQGWNMFGYVCYESQDVEQVFEPIVNDVVIVKNNSGQAFLPEWDFNGIGNLNYAEGYQIKMHSTINDFSLCDNSLNIPTIYGCTNCTALNYNPIATIENNTCIYDINGDGIIDD